MVTGKTYDIEDLKFCLGIPGKYALEQLNIDDIPAVLDLWIKNARKLSNTIKPFDGISNLLEKLVSSVYKLGIVTSRLKDEYNHDFLHFDIASHFDTVICADDTTNHKPTAAPLLKYMELTKADCSELLYIGDTIYDLQCAKNANVDFALADWGSYLTDKSEADFVLEQPSELLNIL